MKPEELKEKYVGTQCVMLTPFKKDESLDEDGIRFITNFLIEHDINVLHPTGSTGEFWTLTEEERKRVIKIVVDEAAGRVPVIPVTAHSGTKPAVELSKYAEKVGADGVMILPPYYHEPTEDGIYAHYKAIADAINIGIVIYNNPWTTKITISPDLMARLADIPNVVAVKETTGDMYLFYIYINQIKDKLTFSSGYGELFAPYTYLAGAKGHITSMACWAPEFPVEIYKAALRKDWDTIKEIQTKLYPYFDFVRREAEVKKTCDYVTIEKTAMNLLGLPGGFPRRPYLPLSDEQVEELRKILITLDLLK